MGGINNFLWMSFIVLVSVGTSANARRNITIPAFRYSTGGQVHNIRRQTINTHCDSTFCYFAINGRRVKIRLSSIEVTPPVRTAPRSFNYDPRQGSSELAGGGGSSTYPGRSYMPRFESSFASCYRDRGRQYVRRDGCTSGDRLRTNCTGSKPSNRSTGYCYRYVKLILQDCGAVPNYLGGVHARNAGPHLLAAGFTRLSTLDPSEAPVGAVIVYNNACSATHPSGHIEIKASETEYISDYTATRPSSENTRCRPVSGIYIRM